MCRRHCHCHHRRYRRPINRKFWGWAIILVLAIGAISSIVNQGHADSSPVAVKPFVAYDATGYSNVDLGLPRANIVYEQKSDRIEWPTKQQFQARVRADIQGPGPVVLDFEDFYLNGPNAQSHYETLSQLADWAKEAAPGHQVGFYGVLGTTDASYYPLARKLAQKTDTFFPELYTYNNDRAAWQARLNADLNQAKSIDPRKPVYPMLWAQYDRNRAPTTERFISASLMASEVQAVKQTCAGYVLWSAPQVATDTGWVSVIKDGIRSQS